MSENDNDRIVDRLRKLIRIGESPNESEAQNALEHAAKLAAKYHIDIASLDISEDDGRRLGNRSSDVVLWGRRRKKYRWELAHVVARAWGCAPWIARRITISLKERPSELLLEEAFIGYMNYYSSEKNKPTVSVAQSGENFNVVVTNTFGRAPFECEYFRLRDCGIVGHAEDAVLIMFGRRDAAEAAIYVYHVLLRAVDDIAKRVASGRSGINSARIGIVFGLRDRLHSLMGIDADLDEDSEPEFDDEATRETAMVLTEARDEARRFLEDSFGRKPYSGTSRLSISDRQSFDAGYEAAEDVEIPDPNSKRQALHGNMTLPVGKDRQIG